MNFSDKLTPRIWGRQGGGGVTEFFDRLHKCEKQKSYGGGGGWGGDPGHQQAGEGPTEKK